VSFTVTILGSGSAVPTNTRFPTAQFVECNNRNILIDCGEGTQFQLRKFNVKIQSIQIILISHLHGDHFFGLPGLLSTMHLLGRDKGLKIIGPEGLENCVRSQLEIGHSKLDFEIEFIALEKNSNACVYKDKVLEIHTFPLNHRIQTQGYLIKEIQGEYNLRKDLVQQENIPLEVIHQLKAGKDFLDSTGKFWKFKQYTLSTKSLLSYAYCSDTKYDERICEKIKGATILYHEATFIEKDSQRAKSTFHSTAADAAKIAHLAGVKKLVMGHISARYSTPKQHEKEAREFFENAIFAEDGMIINLEKVE
jgi:ribonuclease Z